MAFQFRDLFANEEDPSIPGGSAQGTVAPAAAGGAPQTPPGFEPVGGAVRNKPYVFDSGLLTTYIPEHLVSTAAPPQGSITLQLPPTVEDPENRVLRTTLGRIYKACPHLFAQPISEVNDIEVALPLPVRTTAGGAATPMAPPANGSPFSVVEKPSVQTQAQQVRPQPLPPQQQVAPQTQPEQLATAQQTQPTQATPKKTRKSPFQVVKPQEAARDGAMAGIEPAAPDASNGNGAHSPNGNGNGNGAHREVTEAITQRVVPAPPKTTGQVPPVPETPQSRSPFQPIKAQAEPTAPTPPAATPFQVVKDTPPIAPIQPAPKSGNGAPMLDFTLSGLLANSDPAVTEINPASIPVSAQVQIPLSAIKAQISRGKVTLKINELFSYADDLSYGVLAGGNPSAEINIPIRDIFQLLPPDIDLTQVDTGPAPMAAVTPSEKATAMPLETTRKIETPFSNAARQEAKRTTTVKLPPMRTERVKLKAQAAPAAAPPEPQPEKRFPFQESQAAAAAKPKPNPFSNEPKPEPPPSPPAPPKPVEAAAPPAPEPEPAPEPQKPAPVPDNPFAKARARAQQAVDANGAPSVQSHAPESGFNPFMLNEPEPPKAKPKPKQDPTPASEPAKPVAAQSDSLDELPEARPVRPRAKVNPPAETAAPSTPVESSNPAAAAVGDAFAGIGFNDPMKDIELRAVLGGADAFSYQVVLEKLCGWDGINGAAILGGGSLKAARANATEDSKLAEQAPSIYRKVRDLANDLGFEFSQTFTMRTGRGVISFFADGESCLSVLHNESEFEPGVRERLALVARGVAQLEA